MMIDCDSCTVRGAACTDCVVTFLTIPVRPSAGGAGVSARDVEAAPTDHGCPGGGGASTSAPSARTPPPAGTVDLDDDERAAIDVLALSGLVPPLRMVRAM